MQPTQNDIVTDALGNEIVIGKLYGYSRSSSGFSHTTIGTAGSVKNDKVRLIGCVVKDYIYGKPYEPRDDKKASDVSIRGNMIFPIHITPKG